MIVLKPLVQTRPFRYVCEANLEECPAERSFIDVDMAPEKWTRRPTESKYDVPDDARFKYAEDSKEDDVTAECLTSIMVRTITLHGKVLRHVSRLIL